MHACNERCSHRSTPEMLLNLGYDVRIPRPDESVSGRIKCAMSFDKARYEAIVDGTLRLCTRTERVS